jgi:hypothetical protein
VAAPHPWWNWHLTSIFQFVIYFKNVWNCILMQECVGFPLLENVATIVFVQSRSNLYHSTICNTNLKSFITVLQIFLQNNAITVFKNEETFTNIFKIAHQLLWFLTSWFIVVWEGNKKLNSTNYGENESSKHTVLGPIWFSSRKLPVGTQFNFWPKVRALFFSNWLG